MLDTCHNILALDTSGKRCSHFSQMILIFSVALLGTSPSGISGQVNADTAIIVSAYGTYLRADRLTDLLLQFTVKGSASGHGYREAGGGSCHHASGTIHKSYIGNSQTVYRHRGVRFYIIMLNQEQIVQKLLLCYLAGHNTDFLIHCKLPDYFIHKFFNGFLGAILRQYRIFYCLSHDIPPAFFRNRI